MPRQRSFDLNTVKGRLQAFLRHEGLTQTQFARRLGVSPTYVGAMRRGLSVEKTQRLGEVFPHLNREWLLFGDGKMIRGEEVGAPADSDAMRRVPRKVEEDAAAGRGVIEVPLLPVEAFAGNLQEWSSPVLLAECERILSPVEPVDFAIRISGDSMEPEFADGTTLFISRLKDRNFIPWGYPVVMDTTNGVIFKLIYPAEERDEEFPFVVARSLNPRYPPMKIGEDTILGIYRVRAAVRIYNTI